MSIRKRRRLTSVVVGYPDTTGTHLYPTDIRQIKVLLKQAGSAIPKAVSDGDMIAEDSGSLGSLLEQSTDSLT
jgi:hypothetical protein